MTRLTPAAWSALLLAVAPTLSAQTDSTATQPKTLNTVTVQGERSLVRHEGDKTIYHLDALPGIAGADLLEALRRLPSLQFDPCHGLSLHGLTNLTILVDRRPLRLSPEEQEAYLRTLSVQEIASVELIQHPDPSYGSGGSPVLHIITRRQQDEGRQGYARLGAQHQHYLSEDASVRLLTNQGVARSSVGYAFAETRSRETTSVDRRPSWQADVLPRQMHQLSLGASLRLNPRQTLDASFYGTYQRETFEQDASYRTLLKRPRLYTSLQHSYRGDRVESWVTAEGSWAQLKQEELSPQSPFAEDNSSFVRFAPTVLYRLGQKASLFAGFVYDHTSYDYTSRGSTQIFTLWEDQWMPFLGFNASLQQLHLQGSLSFLSTRSHREQGTDATHLTDGLLLPRLSATYALGKLHQLTAEVGSSYTRPDFRDLTPQMTYSHSSWIRSGSPDLRASSQLSYALRYSFMQAAQVELSYSDTKSPIVEQAILNNIGTLFFEKINLDYSRYLRGLFVLPLPLFQGKGISWLTTTTGALQHQWDAGTVARQAYSQRFTTCYVNHRQDLTLGTWSFGLGFTAYGPLYYGLYKMEPTWWMEASLAKRFGAWRLAMHVRDPWNTNTARGSFPSNWGYRPFERDWHQPRLSLSLSYSFGRSSLKGYQERRRNDGTDRMRSEANEDMARGVGR